MLNSIKDVFIEFVDGNRHPPSFAAHRELSDLQREQHSNSAANIVEEVFMRMPTGSNNVKINSGESVMLRELFEQVVIDLDSLPSANSTDDIETWRKFRIAGLERIISMIHGMVISNALLQH